MQQALGAAGFLGLFTNQIEYDPNLVAPAVGAIVMTPDRAHRERAPTNPAMQQLVADVQKVAPDQPIDQSVVAGYWSADLFLAAVQKAGKNLTPASLVKAANDEVHVQGARTPSGPPRSPPRTRAHAVRRARVEQRHRVRGEGARTRAAASSRSSRSRARRRRPVVVHRAGGRLARRRRADARCAATTATRRRHHVPSSA